MRVLVAVAVVLAASLGAVGGAGIDDGLCEPAPMPALGNACLRPDGLYDVVLADGTRLPTHGPDPIPAGDDVGWDDQDEQRAPVCSTASRMEVLYGYPSSGLDRTAEVTADLRAAVRRMNALLNADAVASGGPMADYRVACDASGDIAVTGFKGPSSSSTTYDTVVSAAKAAGFTRAETDYLIFFDGSETGICGVANIWYDSSPGEGNRNLGEIGYGVVYESCWFGRTPMHENGHNQGAVQQLAPMSDATGHCVEGDDVLCYPGERGVTGTVTLGLVRQCVDRVHFDCGFNTYFDAAPEPGEWLASNWNVGSAANRYLAFGDTESPRAGIPAEPEPAPAEAPKPAATTSSTSRAPTSSPSPESTSSSEAPLPAPETVPDEEPAVEEAPVADASAGGSRPAGALAPGIVALAALLAVLSMRRRLA